VLVGVGVRHPLVYSGCRLGDALPAAHEAGMVKSLASSGFARISFWGIQVRGAIGFIGGDFEWLRLV